VVETTAAEPRPELIVALVGPAGIRLSDLERATKDSLGRFGYVCDDISVSKLLANVAGAEPAADVDEFARIARLQALGNTFRNTLKDGAALARAAIVEIRRCRAKVSGAPDVPAPARAYIVSQLKHPDEVELLRKVYGASFVLIAGNAPRSVRIKELARRNARSDPRGGREVQHEGRASDVIANDDKQDDDFGQNTRDTYPMADYFVNLSLPNLETGGPHNVGRFIDLLFGHPFHTPSHQEYAMYLASAASLRSSDGNRQVGAAIVRLHAHGGGRVQNADPVAVGMNEVPRGGGGLYWDGDSPDYRDQALLAHGDDRAGTIKKAALTELLDRMRQCGLIHPDKAAAPATFLAQTLLPHLKKTQFMDIGEFGRTVHAEMASIIDAARRGVAVDGHTMFVTTFPCHNCAKHIIAAGIRHVIYLEPYPKSRADALHGEEIVLESVDGEPQPDKVVFSAFSGLAPRQYRPLFSMAERGVDRGLSINDWEMKRRSLAPCYVKRDGFLAYVATEREALARLPREVYTWDVDAICPRAPVITA
jgi:deoxycytidylate deaminase